MAKIEKGLVPDTGNEARIGENEIDLVAFSLKVLDHWKRILFFCLLGAAAALLITMFLIAPKYEATSQIYVLSSSDSVVNLSDLQLGTYLAADYVEVFQTREVCEQVSAELNLSYTPEQLRSMMQIINPTATRILQIKIKSGDPEEAANLANTFSSVARKYIAKVMQTDAPTVLSDAVPNYRKVSPSKSKNTVLGFAILFVLCIGIEFIQFVTDTTVKSADDLTRVSGIPVFGQVPKIKIKRVSTVKKQDAQAEPGKAGQPEAEEKTEEVIEVKSEAETEGEKA